MIERRRAPSAVGPSTCTPPLSGPRCTIVASISSTRSRPPAVVPQIPHTRGSLFAAARCGGERGRGRLSVHAAPDEAGLPAGEARLVGELEVEERAHVRLAGGEGDRGVQLPRLLPRGDRGDVLLAVVVAAERRRHGGLEAVLEVPDVWTAERLQD